MARCEQSSYWMTVKVNETFECAKVKMHNSHDCADWRLQRYLVLWSRAGLDDVLIMTNRNVASPVRVLNVWRGVDLVQDGRGDILLFANEPKRLLFLNVRNKNCRDVMAGSRMHRWVRL